jgi:hypothetical protein
MFGPSGWSAVVALLVTALYLAVPLGLLYLGLRFLRAYERRGAGAAASVELTARLAALEEQVARVASESERLAESQRFTTSLLAERASGAAQGPPAA